MTTQPVGRPAVAQASESAETSEDTEPSTAETAYVAPVPGLAGPSPIIPIRVGAAGDAEERQADETAAVVVAALRRRRADQPVGRALLVGSGAPPAVRREPSAAAGAGLVGAAGGLLPEPLAVVLRRSSGSGAPLASAVRREIEPVLGADLGAVRTHVGPEATRLNRAMSASAFTLGSDVYFRDGLPDTSDEHGLHLLAHELAHTVQQRTADPARRSLRRTVFNPYGNTALSAQKATGLPMDTLQYHGTTYADGGTTGNSVWMEHMVSNTGGGSAPGEPKGVERIRLVDQRLVWGNGQTQVATAMHAINGDFTHGANNDARNIFMGTAASNTDLHFYQVELPIRQALQSNPAGQAVAYEKALAAHPPIAHPTMAGLVVWCDPKSAFPGAFPIAPTDTTYNHPSLPGPVSHVLAAGPPTVFTTSARPRFVRYTVVPNYTYGAHPGLPPFLVRNLDQGQVLVDEAEALMAAGTPNATQQQIDTQVAAMDYLKKYGHLLFPETFTCEADYYVASYLPATPWYTGHDKETYDAELVRAPKIAPLKKPKAMTAALAIKKVIVKPTTKKKTTKKKKKAKL